MNELALDYKMQGASLMGLENYEKAKMAFVKSIEIEPLAETYMDLGNACACMSDYEGAISAFSNALTLDPNNGEVLFNIGSVYLLMERLTKCLEFYNKAEAAGFKHVRLYINMAAIYKALGDKTMELRNYTKAINVNPLMGELYVKKVMLFIDMHRYAEALEVLDDMRKLFPEAFEGYDLAARIYQGQGKNELAIDILKEGLKKFPEDINLRNSLISVYISSGKIEMAETVLNELKKNKYNNLFEETILMNEISIFSAKNQPENMYKNLQKLVSLEKADECNERVRFMLMMTSILLKKYDTALEMANVLEQQKTKSNFMVSGLYYKGEILRNLGRDVEADAQFKKATKQLRLISMSHRTFYECYLYRALSHKQIKEFDAAIEMGEYIIDLQPDRADGYMILADIYKAMGNEEKSNEQFRIAQQKNPNFQRIGE